MRGLTDRRKWLQLAKENGINKDMFYNRIRNFGWGMELRQPNRVRLHMKRENKHLEQQSVRVFYLKNMFSLPNRMEFLSFGAFFRSNVEPMRQCNPSLLIGSVYPVSPS